MARIVYESDFIENTRLFKKIKAKHVTDAGASPLTALLTEKSIDLTADDTDVDAAIIKHNAFEQAEKDSEKLSAARDKLFTPVFADHRKCVQFLKGLFSDVRTLGDWGVTVDGDSRIAYAPDYSGKQSEVKDFIAKHETFGGITSPLHAFLIENAIDLAVNKTNNNNSLTKHNEFTTKNSDKENFREQRDNLYDPVDIHVHTIGNYLMVLLVNNPQKAGDWGFRIDSSPRADVTRVGSVNTSSEKALTNVALGSELANTGTIPFEIYRGNTAIGSAKTLNASEKFNVLRGYGTLTIKNTSSTTNVSYKATFNR